MHRCRFANSDDGIQIEKLFKRVRDGVKFTALFNWSDQQISQELILSHFYLNADSDGSVQGFIAHRVSVDFVEIMALGTDPSKIKSGLMVSLLNKFVQNFSNQGLQVTLEVHEQNQPAISLYLKCGFKLVGNRPSYYKDGGSALVMTFMS